MGDAKKPDAQDGLDERKASGPEDAQPDCHKRPEESGPSDAADMITADHPRTQEWVEFIRTESNAMTDDQKQPDPIQVQQGIEQKAAEDRAQKDSGIQRDSNLSIAGEMPTADHVQADMESRANRGPNQSVAAEVTFEDQQPNRLDQSEVQPPFDRAASGLVDDKDAPELKHELPPPTPAPGGDQRPQSAPEPIAEPPDELTREEKIAAFKDRARKEFEKHAPDHDEPDR